MEDWKELPDIFYNRDISQTIWSLLSPVTYEPHIEAGNHIPQHDWVCNKVCRAHAHWPFIYSHLWQTNYNIVFRYDYLQHYSSSDRATTTYELLSLAKRRAALTQTKSFEFLPMSYAHNIGTELCDPECIDFLARHLSPSRVGIFIKGRALDLAAPQIILEMWQHSCCYRGATSKKWDQTVCSLLKNSVSPIASEREEQLHGYLREVYRTAVNSNNIHRATLIKSLGIPDVPDANDVMVWLAVSKPANLAFFKFFATTEGKQIDAISAKNKLIYFRQCDTKEMAEAFLTRWPLAASTLREYDPNLSYWYNDFHIELLHQHCPRHLKQHAFPIFMDCLRRARALTNGAVFILQYHRAEIEKMLNESSAVMKRICEENHMQAMMFICKHQLVSLDILREVNGTSMAVDHPTRSALWLDGYLNGLAHTAPQASNKRSMSREPHENSNAKKQRVRE